MKRIATHPGEILKEEYMEPMGLTVQMLASRIKVHRNTLSRVINGRAGVSLGLAVKLAGFFDTTVRFWMNIDTNHRLSKMASDHG